MCAITGFINNKNLTDNYISQYINVLKKSVYRGRTSFGIGLFTPKECKIIKSFDIVDFIFHVETFLYSNRDTYVALSNMRAEPTTEWIKDKTLNDTQPFVYNDLVAVHNGTIANDKEFKKTHSIDSSVFGPLLNSIDSIEKYSNQLKKIVGSYALVTHQINSENIFVGVNYKPLFTMRNNDILFISSLNEFFDEDKYNTKFVITELDPYTLLKINKNTFKTEVVSLYSKNTNNNKAVIVCSGGLDSTVVAAYAKYIDKKEIILLHFRYGCMAEKKEIESIKQIAEYLHCEYKFIDIDFMKKQIGGSTLFSTNENDIKKLDAGVEYAYEWVPARNLVLLSIATAYSETIDANDIYLGINLEEAGSYPDNEQWFINKLNSTLKLSVQNDKQVHIHMPVGNLMKYEIVKLGLEIGAPINLSWSCYKQGVNHCGVCGPCQMRRKAFTMNNIEDQMQYSTKKDNLID